MQIHIHKDGKTYIRIHLTASANTQSRGSFSGNDLACHDGANWIKLADVPKVAQKAEESTKPVAQTKPRKEEDSKRQSAKSVCVYSSFLNFIGYSLSKGAAINYMLDEEESKESSELVYPYTNQVVGCV